MVTVDLACRKNARSGARMERVCGAGEAVCNDILCMYHTLLAIKQSQSRRGECSRVFPGLNATSFASALHADLRACFPALDYRRFSSQSFRRGSATELYNRGNSLSVILIAGGWRSSAFLTYLQRERLDADRFFEALMADEE